MEATIYSGMTDPSKFAVSARNSQNILLNVLFGTCVWNWKSLLRRARLREALGCERANGAEGPRHQGPKSPRAKAPRAKAPLEEALTFPRVSGKLALHK